MSKLVEYAIKPYLKNLTRHGMPWNFPYHIGQLQTQGTKILSPSIFCFCNTLHNSVFFLSVVLFLENFFQHVAENRFPPLLDLPTFAARCLHVPIKASEPGSERCSYGREWCPVILPKLCLFTPPKNLLHVANLQHGTVSFTSLPTEGMLRMFSYVGKLHKTLTIIMAHTEDVGYV
jgi:hypothetical protein